jgi:hypothetical protein
MFTSCKEGGVRGAERTIRKHASILGEGNVFRLLCWGVLHVPKILVLGQSNSSFWKRHMYIVVPLPFWYKLKYFSVLSNFWKLIYYLCWNFNKIKISNQWGEVACARGPSSFSFGGRVMDFCCSQCVPKSSSLDLSFAIGTCMRSPKEEITTYLFWDCWKLH